MRLSLHRRFVRHFRTDRYRCISASFALAVVVAAAVEVEVVEEDLRRHLECKSRLPSELLSL